MAREHIISFHEVANYVGSTEHSAMKLFIDSERVTDGLTQILKTRYPHKMVCGDIIKLGFYETEPFIWDGIKASRLIDF